jgi:MarR family transcriptional regulator for hemolysin
MSMCYQSIIVRLSRIYAERKMARFGIGFPEQTILMFLANGGQIHQDVIARHFMIDKGTIAKTVGKLETKQLVTRQENPANKREKLLALTPAGSSMLGEMQQVLDDWDRQLFQGVGDEDTRKYTEICQIMAANAARAIEKNGSENSGESA